MDGFLIGVEPWYETYFDREEVYSAVSFVVGIVEVSCLRHTCSAEKDSTPTEHFQALRNFALLPYIRVED